VEKLGDQWQWVTETRLVHLVFKLQMELPNRKNKTNAMKMTHKVRSTLHSYFAVSFTLQQLLLCYTFSTDALEESPPENQLSCLFLQTNPLVCHGRNLAQDTFSKAKAKSSLVVRIHIFFCNQSVTAALQGHQTANFSCQGTTKPLLLLFIALCFVSGV
jgi:hypothetical protein